MAENQEGETKFSQRAVVRVGFILLSVLVLFAFARSMLIPDSFGQYGRYRGDSISEAASREPNFAASNEVCGKCHQKQFQALGQKEHGTLNCQTCHGPAEKHVQKPSAMSPKVEGNAELCEPCHRQIAGRTEAQIKTVKIQMHSGGIDCVRCHDPHQPYGKLGGN